MRNTGKRRPQRAAASGRSLSADDAATVKGMLARGDRQHDIAAYFGVNGGRIAEIATGQKFTDVRPADPALLPQPDYPVSALSAAEVLTLDKRLRELALRVERIEREVRRPAPLTLQ